MPSRRLHHLTSQSTCAPRSRPHRDRPPAPRFWPRPPMGSSGWGPQLDSIASTESALSASPRSVVFRSSANSSRHSRLRAPVAFGSATNMAGPASSTAEGSGTIRRKTAACRTERLQVLPSAPMGSSGPAAVADWRVSWVNTGLTLRKLWDCRHPMRAMSWSTGPATSGLSRATRSPCCAGAPAGSRSTICRPTRDWCEVLTGAYGTWRTIVSICSILLATTIPLAGAYRPHTPISGSSIEPETCGPQMGRIA